MRILFCSNYHCCSLIAQPALGFQVSISPESFKVVNTAVTPSTRLHSLIDAKIVLILSSLALRLLNAAASSISMSRVGLSTPLSRGCLCASIVRSNIDSIAVILLPLWGRCVLVLLSSRCLYHYTIVPDLHTSPWLLGVFQNANWPVDKSIFSLCVLNILIPSTRCYTLIGIINSSGSRIKAMGSIHSSLIAILQISQVYTIM